MMDDVDVDVARGVGGVGAGGDPGLGGGRQHISRSGILYGSSHDEVWFDLEQFYREHINEIGGKINELDDEIWGKIILMERNKRVAKAYLRTTTVIVNGGFFGFDGKTIGFNSFDNPFRDSQVEDMRMKIGEGVVLKMDCQGSIVAAAQGTSPVIVQGAGRSGTRRADGQCYSDKLIKLKGRLETISESEGSARDRAAKVFDMKVFKAAIDKELRQPYPNRQELMYKTCIRISLVKDELQPLKTPCWFMVVNLVAMDMLNAKVPLDLPTLASPTSVGQVGMGSLLTLGRRSQSNNDVLSVNPGSSSSEYLSSSSATNTNTTRSTGSSGSGGNHPMSQSASDLYGSLLESPSPPSSVASSRETPAATLQRFLASQQQQQASSTAANGASVNPFPGMIPHNPATYPNIHNAMGISSSGHQQQVNPWAMAAAAQQLQAQLQAQMMSNPNIEQTGLGQIAALANQLAQSLGEHQHQQQQMHTTSNNTLNTGGKNPRGRSWSKSSKSSGYVSESEANMILRHQQSMDPRQKANRMMMGEYEEVDDAELEEEVELNVGDDEDDDDEDDEEIPIPELPLSNYTMNPQKQSKQNSPSNHPLMNSSSAAIENAASHTLGRLGKSSKGSKGGHERFGRDDVYNGSTSSNSSFPNSSTSRSRAGISSARNGSNKLTQKMMANEGGKAQRRTSSPSITSETTSSTNSDSQTSDSGGYLPGEGKMGRGGAMDHKIPSKYMNSNNNNMMGDEDDGKLLMNGDDQYPAAEYGGTTEVEQQVGRGEMEPITVQTDHFSSPSSVTTNHHQPQQQQQHHPSMAEEVYSSSIALKSQISAAAAHQISSRRSKVIKAVSSSSSTSSQQQKNSPTAPNLYLSSPIMKTGDQPHPSSTSPQEDKNRQETAAAAARGDGEGNDTYPIIENKKSSKKGRNHFSSSIEQPQLAAVTRKKESEPATAKVATAVRTVKHTKKISRSKQTKQSTTIAPPSTTTTTKTMITTGGGNQDEDNDTDEYATIDKTTTTAGHVRTANKTGQNLSTDKTAGPPTPQQSDDSNPPPPPPPRRRGGKKARKAPLPPGSGDDPIYGNLTTIQSSPGANSCGQRPKGLLQQKEPPTVTSSVNSEPPNNNKNSIREKDSVRVVGGDTNNYVINESCGAVDDVDVDVESASNNECRVVVDVPSNAVPSLMMKTYYKPAAISGADNNNDDDPHHQQKGWTAAKVEGRQGDPKSKVTFALHDNIAVINNNNYQPPPETVQTTEQNQAPNWETGKVGGITTNNNMVDEGFYSNNDTGSSSCYDEDGTTTTTTTKHHDDHDGRTGEGTGNTVVTTIVYNHHQRQRRQNKINNNGSSGGISNNNNKSSSSQQQSAHLSSAQSNKSLSFSENNNNNNNNKIRSTNKNINNNNNNNINQQQNFDDNSSALSPSSKNSNKRSNVLMTTFSAASRQPPPFLRTAGCGSFGHGDVDDHKMITFIKSPGSGGHHQGFPFSSPAAEGGPNKPPAAAVQSSYNYQARSNGANFKLFGKARTFFATGGERGRGNDGDDDDNVQVVSRNNHRHHEQQVDQQSQPSPHHHQHHHQRSNTNYAGLQDSSFHNNQTAATKSSTTNRPKISTATLSLNMGGTGGGRDDQPRHDGGNGAMMAADRSNIGIIHIGSSKSNSEIDTTTKLSSMMNPEDDDDDDEDDMDDDKVKKEAGHQQITVENPLASLMGVEAGDDHDHSFTNPSTSNTNNHHHLMRTTTTTTRTLRLPHPTIPPQLTPSQSPPNNNNNSISSTTLHKESSEDEDEYDDEEDEYDDGRTTKKGNMLTSPLTRGGGFRGGGAIKQVFNGAGVAGTKNRNPQQHPSFKSTTPTHHHLTSNNTFPNNQNNNNNNNNSIPIPPVRRGRNTSAAAEMGNNNTPALLKRHLFGNGPASHHQQYNPNIFCDDNSSSNNSSSISIAKTNHIDRGNNNNNNGNHHRNHHHHHHHHRHRKTTALSPRSEVCFF